jgi:hypothetical protein
VLGFDLNVKAPFFLVAELAPKMAAKRFPPGVINLVGRRPLSGEGGRGIGRRAAAFLAVARDSLPGAPR